MKLKDRVAIVTGSTSGIGLGIAEALAAEGASIMMNGFGDAAEIENLRAGIAAKHGVEVRFHGADMFKPNEIGAMVRATHEAMGGPHILVNNAGIQFTAPIETFPADKWDAIIAINLSAAFHAMHAAIPLMKQAGWGRIVNIASAHGLVASPFKAAYVAAKHGILGLTKVAAIELANDGDLSRMGCHAACGKTDNRSRGEGRPLHGPGASRHAGGKAADVAVYHAGANRRTLRFPVFGACENDNRGANVD
jgi:3-hydroxybutyrate dehydrogenase